MKNLILETLRSFAEGRLGTHTPTNYKGSNVRNYTKQADLERAMNNIAKATQEFRANYESYGDVYDGDGLYQLDLYPNGELVGKPTHSGRKQEVGYTRPNAQKMSFFVKAYTQIQHDDQPERGGKGVGKSPMNDAKVKVLANYGPDIIEFLKSNMEGEDDYTADDKAAEISKEKTADKWKYKFDKYEKEKERQANKSSISMDDEEKELRSQLMDITRAKVEARKNRNKELVRKLARLEKQLKDKLK